MINQLKPEKPVYCIRRHSVTKASKFFQKNFPGDVLYAVKTNPNEYVLKHIIKSGIDRFDVASINEVKLIRKLNPKSKLYFMHPIKSREDIASAYFDYNVKDYSLDTKEELIKILDSTKNAKDLNFFVRIAVSNEHAELDLSRKFGALTSEALGLVRLCKQHAKKLGIKVISLTGNDGGKLKKISDLNINVDSSSTQRIQEMHIVIGHTICHLIDLAFSEPK